jgi:hypothetical protein
MRTSSWNSRGNGAGSRRLHGLRLGRRTTVGLFGAPFVAALLLLVPAAGAHPLLAPVVHVAPFTGTQDLGSVVSTLGCGASASLAVTPAFNLTTGVGISTGKSSVHGCGLPGFSDTGSTRGISGFDSKPFTGNASYAHVILKFSLNWSFNLSATPASPAGGPSAWAGYSIEAGAFLVDLTTSTYVGGCALMEFNTTNGTTTGKVSGHESMPGTCTVFPKVNLTIPSQKYFMQFVLYATQWSYAPSGTSTVAKAQLNVATGGHEFKAISWSIY